LQRVVLGPLSRKACEAIVRSVRSDLAPERAATLVERSAGNAFFLEELIRFAAEGDVDALPETVLAVLEARLAALDAEARRALRAASVFGDVFWEAGVVALMGEKGCRRATEALVRAELVGKSAGSRFAGATEYAFRHALVRDAAYAMLTPEDRGL